MQVQKLIEIMEFIKTTMDETKIISACENFANYIAALKANPEPAEIILFNKMKEEIVGLQKKNEPRKWMYADYKIFKEINKDNLLGESAIDEMNAIIELNKSLNHNLAQQIQQVVKDMQLLYNHVQSSNTIEDFINKYLPLMDLIPKNQNIVYISYDGNVAINKLNEVEKYSRIWDNILVLFHSLTGEREEEITVSSLDMTNGCFCFGIRAGMNAIKALSNTLTSFLEEYTRIYKIRQVQLEVINLNLAQDIISMLEQEIQSFINEKSHSIVMNIIEKFAVSSSEVNEDKLVIVIRQIIDFIEKGGRINFEGLAIEEEINFSLNNNYDFIAQMKEVISKTQSIIQ